MKQLALILVVFQPTLLFSQQYNREPILQSLMLQNYSNVIDLLTAEPPTDDFTTSDSLRYYNDLGFAYYMNEQARSAMEIYDTIIGIDSMDIQANLYSAMIYADQRAWRPAIVCSNRLISADSGNYRHWYRKGMYQVADNARAEALENFRRAYRLNPSSGKSLIELSKSLWVADQADSARLLIQDFLRRDSSDIDVIAEWIESCYEVDSFQQVIKWGSRLLADSVRVTIPYTRMAYAYLNLSEFSKSEALCEWMMEEQLANEVVLYCNAIAKSKLKKFNESNALLDSCLHLSLQEAARTYFDSKGDNYESLKQWEKAIDCYDSAYYLFKKPLDLYFAGRICETKLKSPSRTKRYYQRMIAMKPSPGNPTEKAVLNYIKNYLKEHSSGAK